MRQPTPLLCLGALVLALGIAGPAASRAEADPAPASTETACAYTGGEDIGLQSNGATMTQAYVGGYSDLGTHRYWLKFDLSFLPSDVDQILSATLTLTAGRKSILPIGVARADDTWSAATLTWDTQPAFGTPSDTVEYTYVAGQPYTWDVTDHVTDEVAGGDGQLSLCLLQDPERVKSANVWFYTDALAPTDAQRPTLCVTYTRASDQPPVVTVGDPLVLRRPDHRMREVHLADLASAEDPEDGALDLSTNARITSVTSDEPADARGGGDGCTCADVVIVSADDVWLRAERAGDGNGRVYTIHFVVTDSGGNEVEASAQVVVPHDAYTDAVDDGPEAGTTVLEVTPFAPRGRGHHGRHRHGHGHGGHARRR
jgi:hypothetical protein